MFETIIDLLIKFVLYTAIGAFFGYLIAKIVNHIKNRQFYRGTSNDCDHGDG